MYEEIRSCHLKGRKDYYCEWCGEVISKGTDHLYRVYVFDGFQTGRMHLECEQAVNKYPHRDELMDGWTFGEMKRGISEPKYGV